MDVPAEHWQHNADHAANDPRPALDGEHRSRARKRLNHREDQLPRSLLLLRVNGIALPGEHERQSKRRPSAGQSRE